MRLVSLRMTGYRQFLEPTSIAFPEGVIGVCGPNGVGKSKIIEAIGYTLYGPRLPILPKGDNARDLPSAAEPGCTHEVELVLELRGQLYRIVRTARTASIYDERSATPVAVTPQEVTNSVIRMLGLTARAYDSTFVARQKQVARLLDMGRGDRTRMVNRLLGISQIETALGLSQQERATRSATHKALVSNIGITVEQARLARDQCQLAKVNAESVAQTKKTERERLQEEHSRAAENWHKLQLTAQEASHLEEQLLGIATHMASLKDSLRAAQDTVLAAKSAASRIRKLHQVAEQRPCIEAEIKHQEALGHLAGLRTKRQAILQDLTTRIAPLSDALDKVTADIMDNEAAARKLNAALTQHTANHASARQEMVAAKDDLEKSERRYNTAQSLGPSGECDTCGQVFGDNLENALSHFEEEASSARDRHAKARQRMEEEQSNIDDVTGHLKALETAHSTLEAKKKTYATIPGEKAVAEKDMADIDAETAEMPETLRQELYVPNAYLQKQAELERVQQAEDTIRQLQQKADEQDVATAEVARIQTEISELGEKQTGIRDRLSNIDVPEHEIENMAVSVADLKARLDEAITQEQSAIEQLAEAKAKLTSAQESLAQATEREQNVQAAHRALLVAERTEQVLNRMLTEITQEARPHLSELMNDWARSVLGPRFRRISLTEDYRLMADNGSREHEIDHFSGGEQTVLALMLRVAISVFCRERAGFDKGFLILDEVFGDQDSERRALLLHFLEEMKPYYHQILVINHVDDVTDMLDSIIDVARTEPDSITSKAAFRI